MALATFKDLCFDAADAQRSGDFWAEALGRRLESSDRGVVLRGEAPHDTIWIDHRAQSTSWQSVIGGAIGGHDDGTLSWIGDIPSTPFDRIIFADVPEPKSVMNRVHIDIVAPSVDPLLAAGATLLRGPDDDIGWHVLADPEGNEFCVFDRT